MIHGIRIRSGYKYCWQHRHADHTESIGVGLVDKFTKSYIKHHKERLRLFLYAWLLVPILFIVFASVMGNGWLELIAIAIFIALPLLKKRMGIKFMGQINNDVENRSEDYITWIEARVGKQKEKRDFQREMLQPLKEEKPGVIERQAKE